MGFPVLETNRLHLKRITPDYANDMFEYLSRDIVTKYLCQEPLTNIEETYKLISELEWEYNECIGIRWGIINKDSNKLIGAIGYDEIQVNNKSAYIGYNVNPDYWRKGFATEAINEIIRYGFIKVGLNRIASMVYSENIASLNLLKKVGFTKEGLLREYIINDGIAKDIVVLSLLKEEYSVVEV